jgi:hypothetical protein
MDDCDLPNGHWFILFNDVGNIYAKPGLDPCLFEYVVSNMSLDWHTGCDYRCDLFYFKKERKFVSDETDEKSEHVHHFGHIFIANSNLCSWNRG